MKYIIVTLIKGEAAEYQQKLLYSIAEKFSISGAIQRKCPAHLTLKCPFESANIALIETCLEKFCRTHKKCSYKLKGISHFDKDVIFINVLPSDKMRKLQHELIESLRGIQGMKFGEFDININFHSSLAHSDVREKFDAVWSFASKKKPEFDVVFDNIAILKLIDGVWNIHKEYKLK